MVTGHWDIWLLKSPCYLEHWDIQLLKSRSYLDTGIFDFSSHHLTLTLGYFTSQVTMLPCTLGYLCPPNEVWETYCVCSVSYYITLTAVGWRIAILCFFFTIIIFILITSPRLLSGDVLLFYVSFSLLLFLLFLFFHTFFSARFLGDALIKFYETL